MLENRCRINVTLIISITFILSMALPVEAGAEVWGLKSKGVYLEPDSGPPTHLFSFTEDGSRFMDKGAVTLDGTEIDVDGLAISPIYGLMAFFLTDRGTSSGASQLITIDPNTAVATAVGSIVLEGRGIRGAGFDSTGSLFVVDSTNDELLRINPLTGEVEDSKNLTLGGSHFDLSDVSDIAMRRDGTFYLSSFSSGARIYTLDSTTGALTLAYETTHTYAYAGLAFSATAEQNELFAYEVQDTDDILVLDLDAGFNSIVLYGNILPSFNAGRGDLAASAVGEIADTCEGDFDHDSDVDGSDLAIFAADFGRTDCEAQILGTWIGDEVSGSPGNWACVFSCNNLEVIGSEEWNRGTFSLNKNSDPYQIDFFITASDNPDNVGKTSLGIYQIAESTLTIAFYPAGNTTRPSSFTPDGTSRVWILNK